MPHLPGIGEISNPVEIVLEHFCQISLNDDHLHRDPGYSWEAYLQS